MTPKFLYPTRPGALGLLGRWAWTRKEGEGRLGCPGHDVRVLGSSALSSAGSRLGILSLCPSTFPSLSKINRGGEVTVLPGTEVGTLGRDLTCSWRPGLPLARTALFRSSPVPPPPGFICTRHPPPAGSAAPMPPGEPGLGLMEHSRSGSRSGLRHLLPVWLGACCLNSLGHGSLFIKWR